MEKSDSHVCLFYSGQQGVLVCVCVCLTHCSISYHSAAGEEGPFY